MRRPAAGACLPWRTSGLIWLAAALLFGSQPGGAAFEFVGAGARAFSLGGAVAAGSGAAEAIWFNPAANARVRRWQAGATYARFYPELDEGLSLSAVDAALPVGPGSLQVGLSSFGIDAWRENVAVLGYGCALHPRLALGVALRTGSWDAGRLSRRVWSGDLGGVYEVGWIHPQAYLRLGTVVRNVNRANLAASRSVAGESPRGLAGAAAVDVGPQTFLAEVERRGGRAQVRLAYESRPPTLGGIEFRLGGGLLTGGWEGKEMAAGFGRGWREWQLDYAYVYPLRLTGLGGIHWLSLEYRGRPAREQADGAGSRRDSLDRRFDPHRVRVPK